MNQRIGRRHFFKMAGLGAGGAAAMLLSQRSYASNPNSASLTADSFRNLAPDKFSVSDSLHRHGWSTLPVITHLRLERVEIQQAIKNREYRSERQPFSLRFSGPESAPLTSATYKMSHPEWSSPVNIFLVRIGPRDENPVYEAIFN